jgi:hypothetical protein
LGLERVGCLTWNLEEIQLCTSELHPFDFIGEILQKNEIFEKFKT